MNANRLQRLLVSASSLAVLAAAGSAAAQGGAAPALPTAPNAADGSSGVVGEVVVTGTRLQATGFTTPTPVSVVTAQQLESRAPISIAQALYDLPALTNGGPSKNTFGSTTIGMNQLNLRNLGATRTLVLVDGRRYVPSSTTTAFDTNLIPTGLVQRTEVVTGGASAQYGSDAVAGVVNIILKDHLTGIHGNAQYGLSRYGDDINYAASLYGGTGFANDKGHIIAGADYSRDGGVGVHSSGPYVRPWGTNEYGAVALTTRPAGVPATVITSNAEFSNMTPGGVIVSGPLRGTAFGPGGSTYTFQYAPLVGNALMAPSTSNYGYFTQARQPLEAQFERYTLFARASYDLDDKTTAYLEANYGHVEGHNNTADPQAGPGGQVSTSGITVAGPLFTATGFAAGSLTNPYLPSSVATAMTTNRLTTIALGKVFPENGGFSTNNTSDTKQLTVGIRGSVFRDWKWDAYAAYGRNRYTLDVPNVLNMPNFYAAAFPALVNGQIVCGTAALNAVNPNLNAITRTQVQSGCVPLNLFGPGTLNTQALSYVRNHMYYYVISKQYVAAANLSGSLFSTWAGPVSTAVGVELRRNSAEATADPVGVYGGNLYGNYQAFGYKPLDVKEGYVEVGVPLAKDMVLARALDLNGAVRRTDYSISGAVTTWKVGASYEPTDFLRFRITKSRDIRAPNLGELYASTGGVTQATNAFTGQQATVPTQAVGNPNLTPEVADTFTTGVVFQPRWSWASSFRFSMDYYQITINNVIAAFPAAVLDAQCFGPTATRLSASYCNQYYVGYDPSVVDPTSPNYRSGVGYTSRRSPGANLNSQKVTGIDYEADYRVPLDTFHAPGRLDLRILASQLQRLETTAPVFNAQGVITGSSSLGNQAGGPNNPKWKFTFTSNYQVGKFAGYVQLIGFTKFKYNSDLVNGVPRYVGPEDPGYNPAASNSINKNRYPGETYVNIGANYDIIASANRRVQIYGTIDNLMNKKPPSGWIQTLSIYDTVGQTFRVGVRFDH